MEGMDMRNIETFAVIGGDLRSAYLAGLLAADGYKVITSGFDGTNLPPCVTGCTNPAQAVTLAGLRNPAFAGDNRRNNSQCSLFSDSHSP